MDPEERSSPYWKAIVGENWPEISPREWGALETVARDGAAALDPGEAERARRAFDDRVRSSVGLQHLKDDMLAQQGSLQGFVDALVAAADTFGQISQLVDRTRNRILDIVGNATRKIRNVPGETSDDDGDGSTEDEQRARVEAIIGAARAEVAEVAAHALNMIGPHGLPELAMIAAALGQPDPWDTGSHGPGHHGDAQPHGQHGPRHSGKPHLPLGGHGRPHGWQLPDGVGVPRIPALQGLERLLEQLGLRPPSSPLPDGPLGGPPGQGVGDSALQAPPPGTSQPAAAQQLPMSGGSSTGVGAVGYGPAPDAPYGARPVGESVGAADSVAPDSGTADSGSHAAAAETVSTSVGDTDHGAAVTSRSAADTSAHAGAPDGGRAVVAPGAVLGSMPGAFAGATAPPPVVVPHSFTSTTAAAPSTAVGQANTLAQGSDVRGSQGVDPRTSTAGPRGPAVSPPSTSGVPAPGVSMPPGKSQPPTRADPVVPVAPDADVENSEKGGSDDLRNAVGAAMMAAAGPTFMLGARVDGDLALARTLLSSLLAAAESATVGTAWAVSVLRHSDGIGAFVTSNEGRGWVPAGVFLPRELSTPWVFSISEGSAWEDVADPARVLAEFAVSWGGKTGARLSALASSLPVDAGLGRQLGEVPTAGSVGAAAMMDFSAPATGLVDRLELVGSPQLMERAAAVPADRIGWRCVELAVDAHVRVGRMGPSAATALGTAVVRERILQALRRGQPVAAQWWDELRDADDLVAASMLPLKADVSRVPLGELRSDTSSGRSASDASALRAMLFERRCDELVLLLAGEPTRQRLRDAIYAHGQLVDHPSFTQMSSATPEAEPAPRRPTIIAPLAR